MASAEAYVKPVSIRVDSEEVDDNENDNDDGTFGSGLSRVATLTRMESTLSMQGNVALTPRELVNEALTTKETVYFKGGTIMEDDHDSTTNDHDDSKNNSNDNTDQDEKKNDSCDTMTSLIEKFCCQSKKCSTLTYNNCCVLTLFSKKGDPAKNRCIFVD